MVYHNEDGSITSNAAPRTMIGQSAIIAANAIIAAKDAEIARLTARAEKAEAALSESQAREAMLHRAITEASEPDFIWGAMDNVNDMDADLDDFAKAASRAIRAAVPTPADARAIALVPELLDEVISLREKIAELESDVSKYHDAWLEAEGKHSDEKHRADKAEAALWRVPPNTHTIPSDHPLGKKEPDPFEGPGETYRDAYIRVLAERDTARAETAMGYRNCLTLLRDVGLAGDHDTDPLSQMFMDQCPADAQDALASRINAAREEGRIAGLRESSKWLGELLAIIHRDDGHYQAQHGDEKAVADAHIILARMFSQPEAETVLLEVIEWAHRQPGNYPNWFDRARKAVGQFDGDAGQPEAERDAIAAAKEEGRIAGLREAADTAEDYCSDMPDLAGHGHSMGLKDAILAKIKEAE